MTKRKKKIIGIAGSLRKNSASALVLAKISTLFSEDIDFTIFQGIGSIPHFNDADVPDQHVTEFRSLIKAADGVIICQPEYAFGVSGSLKNALDWTVGSGEFNGKPVALITAATGGENAHEAMLKTLRVIDCQLSEETNYLLDAVKAKIDTAGNFRSDTIKEDVTAVLRALETRINSIIVN